MRHTRFLLAVWSTIVLAVTAWILFVDLQYHSCGWAWDWWNMPSCSYWAVAREVVMVDGALFGFAAFLMQLGKESDG